MILVEVQCTVAAERGEEVSVLREVSYTPDGRFVSELVVAAVALLWVVCFHVKDVELGLECGHDHLVHVDVGSVEFDSADSVSDVCVPAEAVRPEVEELHITVVVTRDEAAFLLVEGVAKGDGPAVRLNCLTF